MEKGQVLEESGVLWTEEEKGTEQEKAALRVSSYHLYNYLFDWLRDHLFDLCLPHV